MATVYRPTCGVHSISLRCLPFVPSGLPLLQGAGKRRWAIEDTFTSGEKEEKRSVQDIDLRVLADFKETQVNYKTPFRRLKYHAVCSLCFG